MMLTKLQLIPYSKFMEEITERDPTQSAEEIAKKLYGPYARLADLDLGQLESIQEQMGGTSKRKETPVASTPEPPKQPEPISSQTPISEQTSTKELTGLLSRLKPKQE